MRIVKLTAENFKRLVAVEITPDGHVIKITGKNGAGKSSVLDSIVAALGGGREAPAMPIRAGEEKSIVAVETEDYTITRTFTEKGSYLTITNAEGFKATSPQALLNKIVGQIAFDPLAFIREKDAKAQRAVLLDLVGLDLGNLDANIALAKSDASHARKQVTLGKAKLDELANVPDELGDDTKEEPLIDIGNLVERLLEATTEVQQQESLQSSLEVKTKTIQAHETKIEELRKAIATLKEECENVRAALANRPKVEDPANLQDEIDASKAKNAEIAKRNEAIQSARDMAIKAVEKKRATRDMLTEWEGKLRELTTAVADLEARKTERLAKAAFPVPGLSVDENGITFDGIPLAQVNHAKQLEIGMRISMALNPTLRVMLIDGNGLDSETLGAIEKAATEADYQVWMEQMDETGEVGIVIEDGHIKAKGVEQCTEELQPSS